MTVIWGILCLFFLPDTPHSSKFLTEEERSLAVARMRVDAHGATSEDLVEHEHFKWHWVRMALLSPNTWFASFTVSSPRVIAYFQEIKIVPVVL